MAFDTKNKIVKIVTEGREKFPYPCSICSLEILVQKDYERTF